MNVLTDVLTSCNDSYMNKTTAAPYAAAQSVEVYVTDFATAGMPKVWVAGQVAGVVLVDEVRRLWDVTVVRVDGIREVLRVGPRGGGKAVRAAVAA